MRWPARTSARCFWPLPSTPAMPMISPGLTSRSAPSRAHSPRCPAVRPPRSTRSGSIPATAFCLACGSAASPTRVARRSSAFPPCPNIIATTRSMIASGDIVRSSPGLTSPTTRPWRSTDMRSARSLASFSLWVMKTMATPWSRSRRMTTPRSSTPWGVSIEVGSSRKRTSSPCHRARMISTCCCSPRESLPTGASGDTLKESSSASSVNRSDVAARSRVRDHEPPSIRFSRTVRLGTRRTC